MFNLENLSLQFNINYFYLILFAIVLIAYVILNYKYTIPQISKSLKIILIISRSIALILLLALIFEPLLTLTRKFTIKPVNLIFVDNSRSISFKDQFNRKEIIKNFLNDAEKNNLLNQSKIFSFGSNIKEHDNSELNQLKYNDGSTNFTNIFNKIKNLNSDISTITILSDGVITDGDNPIYMIENSDIPIFTIGLGDSTQKKDIELTNVLHNEIIYANTETSILTTIRQKGFDNQKVSVSFYEENKLLDKQEINFGNDEIKTVSFKYLPKESGEKKLSVYVSVLNGEFSKENNRKIFFVNVLSDKIKIGLVSGYLSPDVSFIKNSLLSDTNLVINTFTIIGNNKFLEKNYSEKSLDSSDVLFLINFPSEETPNNFLQKINNVISNKNIPYFITVSNYVSMNKLKQLSNELPFSFSNSGSGTILVQPNFIDDEINNPILQNNAINIVNAWNNLPPVNAPNWNFISKPESRILLKSKVNNVPLNTPLLLSKILGRKRAIAVCASDIWRWKLQNVNKDSDLFDRFILNSVKWLNANEERKQFDVQTTKKLYSLNEQIQFQGELYDESFNPINNAEVNVKIKNENYESEITLNSIGNGLYEGILQDLKTGDYTFNAIAKLNGTSLKSNGRFSVGDIDLELINPQQNANFLKLLSNTTNGKYYFNNDYKDVFERINQTNQRFNKEKIEVSEINLWSNEILLIILILLFALEWFLRKREGML